MRKLLMLVLILTIVVSVPALAQWNFVKVFPDTNLEGSTGVHGLAVDPEGKLWVQFYGNTTTIVNDTGGVIGTRQLFVFNPDGSEAPFSGLNTVDINGEIDTLFNSARGLRADHNGNILASHFDELFRINYTNGQGMAKMQPVPGSTLDAVCVTDLGEVIAGFVIPPLPIKIYDENFTFLGNAVDSAFGFSRAFEISKDGNDIYWGSFTTGHTVKIHSDFGTLGPYSTFDTILVGMKPESFGWNPKDGYLYLSSGNFSDVPSPEWTNHTWYAYDPATNTVKDSLTWNFAAYPYPTDATFGPRARAIAFSPGGDTAYVGMYNHAKAAIQMFVRGVTSVEPIGTTVPEEYTLSQNYPNPFNPTTEIQFSIPASGQTSLIVYDMLGREVATLVNDNLTAGSYKAKFDAASLSSGTYVYILTSNGYRITKKMMLIK